MIGEQIGNWSVYKELGRGGMGRVYLAREELTGRLAAIKVLSPELAQEGGFLQRFQQEIETLRILDHPKIVKFYEADFDSGVHYYAMEYVEGQSLERVLARQKRLPWSEVLDMALQICPGLKHAHDHGIIHRDLKPGNLLRTTTGEIKLSDFGIAKVFAGTHLTATGNIVGTAEYISPEQCSGKQVTKRSDLYSLGIVLYVLLVGKPPFTGKGPIDLIHKHQYGRFDPPSEFVADLPREFNDIVCQLLEKDPAKRPPDCLVLSRKLERVKNKSVQKEQGTEAFVLKDQTVAEAGVSQPERSKEEGPATLMSRLVRAELEKQKYGGPVARFINHPAVLVAGLLLCIAGIAYAISNGAAWSTSADPPHKKTPKEESFPDVASAELQRALLLKEQGRNKEAKQKLENIIKAFGPLAAQADNVKQAEQALKTIEKEEADKKRWQPVGDAVKKAKELFKQNKAKEAEEILQAIERLYQNDPAAGPLIEEIRKVRKRKQK